MEREKKWIFHGERIRWNWDIIIWKGEEEMLDTMKNKEREKEKKKR